MNGNMERKEQPQLIVAAPHILPPSRSMLVFPLIFHFMYHSFAVRGRGKRGVITRINPHFER
jgi:hypothetical protein